MQCYSMYYYYTYCVVAIYHDCGIVILVQYRVPTGTMYIDHSTCTSKVLVLSIVHIPGVQYCTVVEYAVLDLVLL